MHKEKFQELKPGETDLAGKSGSSRKSGLDRLVNTMGAAQHQREKEGILPDNTRIQQIMAVLEQRQGPARGGQACIEESGSTFPVTEGIKNLEESLDQQCYTPNQRNKYYSQYVSEEQFKRLKQEERQRQLMDYAKKIGEFTQKILTSAFDEKHLDRLEQHYRDTVVNFLYGTEPGEDRDSGSREFKTMITEQIMKSKQKMKNGNVSTHDIREGFQEAVKEHKFFKVHLEPWLKDLQRCTELYDRLKHKKDAYKVDCKTIDKYLQSEEYLQSRRSVSQDIIDASNDASQSLIKSEKIATDFWPNIAKGAFKVADQQLEDLKEALEEVNEKLYEIQQARVIPEFKRTPISDGDYFELPRGQEELPDETREKSLKRLREAEETNMRRKKPTKSDDL